MAPRVVVLRAAGSNCDIETKIAFDSVGADAHLVHINRLLENKLTLNDYQILAIPGGFTYGDDISAGKILANELKYKLSDSLRKFHEDGRLIIGICNGFQVLVKAGLLPAINFESEQLVTLTNNDSGKFEDRWVYLKVNKSVSVFTQGIPEMIYLPVAHAEGKFVPRNQSVLRALKENRQVVFQYTAPGEETVKYPFNPNGSVDDIAGICDPTGRVLGMMPHPERYMDPTNHPRWTRMGTNEEAHGIAIFRNAVKYFL